MYVHRSGYEFPRIGIFNDAITIGNHRPPNIRDVVHIHASPNDFLLGNEGISFGVASFPCSIGMWRTPSLSVALNGLNYGDGFFCLCCQES